MAVLPFLNSKTLTLQISISFIRMHDLYTGRAGTRHQDIAYCKKLLCDRPVAWRFGQDVSKRGNIEKGTCHGPSILRSGAKTYEGHHVHVEETGCDHDCHDAGDLAWRLVGGSGPRWAGAIELRNGEPHHSSAEW